MLSVPFEDFNYQRCLDRLDEITQNLTQLPKVAKDERTTLEEVDSISKSIDQLLAVSRLSEVEVERLEHVTSGYKTAYTIAQVRPFNIAEEMESTDVDLGPEYHNVVAAGNDAQRVATQMLKGAIDTVFQKLEIQVRAYNNKDLLDAYIHTELP